MREDPRTLGVIHSARFIGGGSGLARYGPEALVCTCSLNAESSGAHVAAHKAIGGDDGATDTYGA